MSYVEEFRADIQAVTDDFGMPQVNLHLPGSRILGFETTEFDSALRFTLEDEPKTVGGVLELRTFGVSRICRAVRFATRGTKLVEVSPFSVVEDPEMIEAALDAAHFPLASLESKKALSVLTQAEKYSHSVWLAKRDQERAELRAMRYSIAEASCRHLA